MERLNPWWTGEPDQTYQNWSKLKVNWVPREIGELSLEPFSLNFLSGPRQVGKTTSVKLLINQLRLKRDPRSIFYLACDEIADFRELSEVLDDYLKARESWKIRSACVFLDEVTFVRDWWRPVKAKIDDGSFRNDVVTITGSASLELLKERERFPGRRGKGSDVIMRPLGFRSYVKALAKLEPSAIAEISRYEDALTANSVFAQTLQDLFLSYLKTGGFPLAVREMTEDGRVGEDSRRSLVDGLIGDWNRAGRENSFMKEVISYVCQARGSPVSWLSIAKATSIHSPNTVRSYIATLQDLLVLMSMNLIEPDGGVAYRKNKKLHFTDPFVYNSLARYAGLEADEPAVVEGTVSSHLARAYDVFYWRNGSEADAIFTEGGNQYAVEVKWGFKKGLRPKHVKHYISLDRRSIPVFLVSLPFA